MTLKDHLEQHPKPSTTKPSSRIHPKHLTTYMCADTCVRVYVCMYMYVCMYGDSRSERLGLARPCNTILVHTHARL